MAYFPDRDKSKLREVTVTEQSLCPHCGKAVEKYKNPLPTVDVVIFDPGRGVVLVKRKNEPHGWALPGGFVDYGERVEAAAIREAREETGLEVRLTRLLGVYSAPDRDPRHHTLSVVFVGQALNPSELKAADDATSAEFFPLNRWPEPVVFDHRDILNDFSKIVELFNPGMEF